MNEEWRAIPGWEGFYEVSSEGRIRSVRRLVPINSVTPERKRWMGGGVRKLTRQKDGYLAATLTGDGRRELMMAHRAVLLAFVGQPEEGSVARHLNGTPTDNQPKNLCWGTHEENMQDRKRHGRYTAGASHPMAKLTDEQAIAIFNSPLGAADLSRQYGIHKSKIWAIKTGKTWGSVTGSQQ